MLKLIVVLVLLVGFGAAWFIAGRAKGPDVNVVWPTTAIGQSGDMRLELRSPKNQLAQVTAELVQGENSIAVLALTGDDEARLQADSGLVRVTSKVGKQHFPALVEGPARLIVKASRPTFFGLQQAWTTVERDLTVRLTPPRVAVLSQFHYINHGGSEIVVYRVTGDAVFSGVRVGEREYPGFPAAGAGVAAADSSTRVAFFALLWDQDTKTPITVFARDDAGNESSANFDFRVFPKVFRKSTINLDDAFLAKVVPTILQNSPDLKVENPSDLIGSYVSINRELRRMNNASIAALAAKTAPTKLWDGPFRQLVNTAVEAGFADQRTYVYQNREVDKQTHLGFDLASTAAAPVLSANAGKVVFAGWLGIYGNCVIVDHGMGLQSLYAHLSSIDVKDGDPVQTSSQLGKSGATGLAGGDHLHFTMLLGGNPVTPIDWWSAQWVEDRILRKLTSTY